MKRFFLLFLVLALAVACSPKTTPAGKSGKAASDIVILYDNDVHCSVDGYAKMAALKAEKKAQTPYVTVVSAGDYVQGGSMGAASKGGYIVTIMNAVGYDLVTLGNHEFDYAIPRLKEISKELKATILCCNLIDLKADARMFKPYEIVDYGGTKVAFIGAATPYSFNSSTPAYFQDDKGNYVYSLSADTYYDTFQNFINDARNQGADYVVALTHLGDDVNYDPINSQELARQTEGLDVILDGHSHSLVPQRILTNKAGKSVLYSQTGAHFDNIGVMTISPNGEINLSLVSTKDYTKEDPRVRSVIDKLKAEYAAQGARKIGYNEVMLPAKNAEGDWLVRAGETSLGDLCADAFRVCLGTDIAIVGGGSLRKDLPAGDVRFDDIFNVFPFNNNAAVATLTGQEILDALEFGVAAYPTDFGGFPHVSGMTFEFDPSVESPVVYDVNKAFVRINAGERRVRNVKVYNPETQLYERIDPAKEYTVGGSTYMLKDAGDGYELLKGKGRDTGVVDLDILEKYIVEKLGGRISAAQYGESQDRLIKR
ncbi:MAG: bifunctional metallophosphatase/5'-nucleotidase [Bacteroidales bacterium]|nr:bifunctional metallophosphatase/5'-nucleotidase [Bacteroidales bacterium]MBQ1636635.1 bifunctional metallophosphatase/5'-nucleotidase [Bacteroidales bacterium]MBQ1753625.1 bifunctional metallophosphatase/5'-nucleotidase [Bacteroidales bacterium]MBQ1831323.1 bifunctional metallophosphatase/5'-nucleotidase [Bacteroidales bacterium]MBQ2148649.1 bifunctional metallophosphatase/5'-nucleotidase [Bacteroidales bacterium]